MKQFHPLSALSTKTGATVLLVVAADLLFFGQPAGISTALFAALLIAAIVAVHPAGARRARLAHAAIGLGALLPLVETVSGLSLSIAAFAIPAFALSISGRLRASPVAIAGQLGGFLVAAPFRLPADLGRSRQAARRTGRRLARAGGLAVWLMPVVLGAVFLALFGIANPVIDYWLSLIDVWIFVDLLDVVRIAFWLLVAIVVWAVLRPRLPQWLRRPRPVLSLIKVEETPEMAVAARRTETIFGRAAILRSLIVFNAIFAVQTALDGAYLGWRRAARRPQLRGIRTSRRIPADRNRAARGRLRAHRHAARQPDLSGPASACACLPLDSAERGAGHLLDAAARPLYQLLFADISARGRLYLDGPRRHRARADHGADRSGKIEPMATHGQPDDAFGGALRRLLHQLRRHHRHLTT